MKTALSFSLPVLFIFLLGLSLKFWIMQTAVIPNPTIIRLSNPGHELGKDYTSSIESHIRSAHSFFQFPFKVN